MSKTQWKKKSSAFFMAMAVMATLFVPGFGTREVSAKEVLVESFSLHKKSHNMQVGKTATFSIVNVFPTNSSNIADAIWQSSDPDVVEITGKAPGQVRAKANGAAKIYCHIGGVMSTAIITVGAANPVTSFTLNKNVVVTTVGDMFGLWKENVAPEAATNIYADKWFSSNPDLLEPQGSKGLYVAKKAGYTTLTCQIGAVKMYCKVYVRENP